MNPFEHLGIRVDADEAAIKRAYALGLRRYRPDEDPAGFQCLHEAYQAALFHCRSRMTPGYDEPQPAVKRACAPADSTGRQTSDAPPQRACAPEHCEPAQARTEPRDLLRELISHATLSSPEQFERYLYERPEFLSLTAKEAAGTEIITYLFEQSPPVPADAFDILLDFFNHASVDTTLDPLALASQRTRMQLAWELQARSHAEYVTRRRRVRGGTADVPSFTPAIRRALGAPFRRWRARLLALLPGLIERHSQFIASLDGGRIDRLPPEFDRTALHFWMATATPESLPWYAIRTARALAVTCVLALTLVSGAYERSTDIQGLIAFGLIGCEGYLCVLAWRGLRRWLILPESATERLRALRLLFLPICATAPPLLAEHAPSGYAKPAAIGVTAFLLALAIARYRMRAGNKPLNVWNWNISTLYGVAMLAFLIGVTVIVQPLSGTALILFVCALDLWMQRGPLRRAWNRVSASKSTATQP